MKDQIQESIIDEFSIFDDWLDKYDYLISLSESLPAIDQAKRNDTYLIEGCQSRVWVAAELRDNKVYYTADSDAIITKGVQKYVIKAFTAHFCCVNKNRQISFCFFLSNILL